MVHNSLLRCVYQVSDVKGWIPREEITVIERVISDASSHLSSNIREVSNYTTEAIFAFVIRCASSTFFELRLASGGERPCEGGYTSKTGIAILMITTCLVDSPTFAYTSVPIAVSAKTLEVLKATSTVMQTRLQQNILIYAFNFKLLVKQGRLIRFSHGPVSFELRCYVRPGELVEIHHVTYLVRQITTSSKFNRGCGDISGMLQT